MIIIEKTSYHSRFQKAAPIGVEKLAYAKLLNLLVIIQSVFCHPQKMFLSSNSYLLNLLARDSKRLSTYSAFGSLINI